MAAFSVGCARQNGEHRLSVVGVPEHIITTKLHRGSSCCISATEGRPRPLSWTAARNSLSDCIRSLSHHPTLSLVSVSVLHKACVALI